MKQGKTLQQLATALEDIRANSKDLLVPTSKLEMSTRGELTVRNGDHTFFKPTDYAHSQIAAYSGIPKAYYDKIRSETPELLSRNVNHGIDLATENNKKRPETRLVRTHKGNVRAFLSSSYRRLDSYDMAQTVLPILVEKEMQVVSSELTDTRMYIKALSPRITSEITKGDMVQYGLVISNSDVGAGSVRVEPLIYRLVCQNGMISNTSVKKFHIGKNMATDDVQHLLSEETMNLTDKAFWAQIHDIVLASMNPDRFEFEVERLREAAGQKIKNFDIPEVVELSMKALNLTGEGVKNNIVSYLANGADGAGLTKWGLVNGFTYAAQQDNVNYDQSIELERAGSKILDLSSHQWKRIAEEVRA